jgi:hypothetical protein
MLALLDRHISALQEQIDYYRGDRKWTLQLDRWRAIRDYLKAIRAEIVALESRVVGPAE